MLKVNESALRSLVKPDVLTQGIGRRTVSPVTPWRVVTTTPSCQTDIHVLLNSTRSGNESGMKAKPVQEA